MAASAVRRPAFPDGFFIITIVIEIPKRKITDITVHNCRIFLEANRGLRDFGAPLPASVFKVMLFQNQVLLIAAGISQISHFLSPIDKAHQTKTCLSSPAHRSGIQGITFSWCRQALLAHRLHVAISPIRPDQ